jgi:hypothetical protein
MRRFALLVIFFLFLSAPVAQATTYCLLDSSCSGTTVTSLQQALDLSSSDSDLDRIGIGDTRGLAPISGGDYHSANPLQIAGSGPGVTTLGGSTTVLSLGNNSDVSVSNLTLAVQAGSAVGLELAGARAEHVSVVMQADSSTAAIFATAGTSSIDDAVVELGTTVAPALKVANGTGLNTILDARHLTIIGSGNAGQAGASVAAGSSGQTMVLNLRSSIIQDVEHSLTRSAPTGTAVINTDYSNYDATTQINPPDSGGISSHGQSNVPPGFVDAAQHDYRLTAGSALIDRGDPAPLGSGEPATDLGGTPRRLNGDSDCVPQQDVGAYEFLAPAVFASASAAPSRALTGQAVTFNGSASCDPDPTATLTYGWSFDDGTSGSGPSLPHAFGTSGNHSAQLMVKSSTGRVGFATATVGISSPPAIESTTPSPSPFSRTRLHPPVLITRRTVSISRTGIATIALRCEGNVRCVGRVQLQTLRPVSALAARQVQKLGSARFSIPAGRISNVKIRVQKPKLRVIRTRKRLAARVSVTDTDSAGRIRIVTRTVQLKTH